MPSRVWQSTPQQSIQRECRRRGRASFVEACSRMLDGDASDAELVIALGGPPGQDLINRGIPENLRYWLRVWASRGLFWVWADDALPYVLDAAEDEHWRVREWVGKIAAKHGLPETIPVLHHLADDAIPRVRSAAVRALDVLIER